MNPSNIYLTNDILRSSHRRERDRQQMISEARAAQARPHRRRSLPIWTLVLRTLGR